MMKKIWKIVSLVSGLLLALGIICLEVAFAMGGSFQALMDDHLANHVITWLAPSSFFPAILPFF